MSIRRLLSGCTPCVLLAVVSCSGGDRGERVSETVQAFDVPALRPSPPGWKGSYVQLMFADAAASCSYSNDTTRTDAVDWMDIALGDVIGQINASRCPGVSVASVFDSWTVHRSDTSCTDATPQKSMGPLGAPYIQKTVIPVSLPGDAGRALRSAPFNLCVAQKLRDLSPGAAGAEALLLSGEDQRALLETTRERAQIAMLDYALLGLVFAPPGPSTAGATGSATAQIRTWARANATQVSAMGRDFAAAVQLEIQTAQEMAQILARSGSARLPRGGSATGADEIWGRGSWRQRMMALLYGGDPLVQEVNGSSPWTHPHPLYFPGQGLAGARPGDLTAMTGPAQQDWPTPYESPYVRADVQEPQVQTLERLARRAGALNLKINPVTSGSSGCRFAVDRPTSSSLLYKMVESWIRTSDCEQTVDLGDGSDPICLVSDPQRLPDPAASYSTFLLYQKYGITPSHAASLIAELDDLAVNLCPNPSGTNSPPAWGAVASGAYDLNGQIWSQTAIGGVQGPFWHISSDAQLMPKGLEQHEAMYSRYAHFRAPSRIDDSVPIYEQELIASAYPGGESKRVLGAVDALIAARELVEAAHVAGPSDPTVGAFLGRRPSILEAIGSAVGETSVAVLADASAKTTGVNRAEAMQTSSRAGFGFEVRVSAPTGDPFWDPTQPGALSVVAVPNDPTVPSMVLYPGSSGFTTLAGDLAAGGNAAISAPATAADVHSSPDLVNPIARWRFHVDLRQVFNQYWTFLGKKTAPGKPDQYVLLTANVSLGAFHQSYVQSTVDAHGNAVLTYTDFLRPIEGQYHSFDGSLNTAAKFALLKDPDNRARPLYDGFGLPARYVPPFDPVLFGGQTGESAVDSYLSRAATAADGAAKAVQSALDAMLTVAQDDTARLNNAQKSAALLTIETSALCGNSNPHCDTTMIPQTIDFSAAWTGAPPTCPDPAAVTDADKVKNKLDCATLGLLQTLHLQTSIARPVALHLADTSQPPFDDYAGGTMQGALGEQWAEVRAAYNAATDLITANTAAKARVDAFQAALDSVSAKVKANCSDDAMMAAGAAGLSVGVSGGFLSATVSTNWSPGPLIAQHQKCDDLKLDVDPAKFQDIDAMWEAIATINAQGSKLGLAAKALQQSSASTFQLIENARLAIARETLEADISNQSQDLKTSFGLYRAYESDSVFRAKALLENARREAVLARRAIEARFVVDLSQMTAAEPLVAAPSSWADQVYGYELDIPAAVGLTIGTKAPGTIYPYNLTDYVGNLQSFVEGYAISRPSAVSREDVNVVSLAGPIPSASNAANEAFAWTFYCPPTGTLPATWVGLPGSGNLADACSGVKPVRARIAFSLDPWGRLNQDAAHPPVVKNYNARWSKLAVNIVGSSVRDCTTSPNPVACWNDTFVYFNMTHLGPAWTTDYDEHWRSLGVPRGVIEDGKALAREVLLDISSWTNTSAGSAYVNAVAKTEYSERPFGGVYEIDLNPDSDPVVQLDQIEGIQILVSSDAWVKQQ